MANRKIFLKGVALEALWISDVEFLLRAFPRIAFLCLEHMALKEVDGLGGVDNGCGDEKGGIFGSGQNELQQSGIGP